MLRHIVAWTLKDEFSEQEKAAIKIELKKQIEALVGVIPEIKELKVITEMIERSNMDITLDSAFESAEALAIYRDHPAHVAVGDYLDTVYQDRTVLDYIED